MELCTPDTRRSNQLYSPPVLPDASFVYYFCWYIQFTFNLYTGDPLQPHARVRSGSVAKAGVGVGYRQTQYDSSVPEYAWQSRLSHADPPSCSRSQPLPKAAQGVGLQRHLCLGRGEE